MMRETISLQSARLPALVFGPGVVQQVGEKAAQWGQRVLLISASASFDRLEQRFGLLEILTQGDRVLVGHRRISVEPSPQQVDEIVTEFYSQQVEVVVAIGGGSVLDAAKCIAGLLPSGDSVMEYLEGGGGGGQYQGPSIPLIAVPTTAGTGSEASMNGVLSDRQQGFKKSFRHPALIPQLALIDPDLLVTSPPALIAANGCDALSQLLESYLSTQATPFTDSLALEAIARIGGGLIPLWESAGEDAAARSAVAYGAMISGITLANAGLGVVHGLAGPIGGLFPVPHGVVCGTLLGVANRTNIEALRERDPDSVALQKYCMIGKKMALCEPSKGRSRRLDQLSSGLMSLVEKLQIPRLREYGITESDIPRILQHSDQKANPVVLTEREFGGIVQARI